MDEYYKKVEKQNESKILLNQKYRNEKSFLYKV